MKSMVLSQVLSYLKACRKKLLLIVSVLAFRNQKYSSDYNREKRLLFRWLRILAVFQDCLLSKLSLDGALS